MATITLRQASRLGGYAKPYVAKILGSDPQYKFARSFLDPVETTFGGDWTFDVTADGLYEVCDRNSKGAKRLYWYVLAAGVLQECVSDDVAGEWIAALDAAKPQTVAATTTEQSIEERHARYADTIESDPIANAQAATELAVDKAAALGANKDQWLPYVRAALTFWGRIQVRALADDNTRASFEAANQQLLFGKEFKSLTGRDFDLTVDAITYAEIKAL